MNPMLAFYRMQDDVHGYKCLLENTARAFAVDGGSLFQSREREILLLIFRSPARCCIGDLESHDLIYSYESQIPEYQ